MLTFVSMVRLPLVSHYDLMMDHQKWILLPNLMAFQPAVVKTFHIIPPNKSEYVFI